LYILNSKIAALLKKASVKAGLSANEICAVLYVRNHRIYGFDFIKNYSQKPYRMIIELTDLNKRKINGAHECIFFHNHPEAEFLSKNDMLNSIDFKMDFMIYNNFYNRFYLYGSKSLKKSTITRISKNRVESISSNVRRKIYVETGIKSFDELIISNKKTETFISDLKKWIGTFIGSRHRLTQQINKNGHLNKKMFPKFDKSNSVLSQFYDGLFLRLPETENDLEKLAISNMTKQEKALLSSSYDLFYGISLYFDELLEMSERKSNKTPHTAAPPPRIFHPTG